MAKKFGRKYLLRIAKNPHQVKEASEDVIEESSSGGGIKEPVTGDLLTMPPLTDLQAVAISQLHFEVSIPSNKRKNSTSEPVIFNLFNLSKETRDKIQAESTIILQAGYDEDIDLPIVYAGQVVSVGTTRTKGSRVTKLVCNGAYTIQKNVRLSRTFRKGITYKELIEEIIQIAGSYGLPLGHFKLEPEVKTKDSKNTTDKLSLKLEDGFSMEGKLLTNLVELVGDIGYKAYITLGKLYIEPREFPSTVVAVDLNPEHIIGQIQPTLNSSKTLTGSPTPRSGIELTTFLEGNISLDKKIRILKGDYAGVYDIEDLRHNLSYEGSNWATKLKLVRLGD